MCYYRVTVSSRAKKDLKEIITHITVALANPIAAARLERDIRAKIKSLSFMPCRNRVKDNVYALKIRQYRIIYLVLDENVVVVTIKHCRQLFNIELLLGP